MSQLIKRITKKGFTLIELMIVVAIIGILAAIAIPKFADLITKSRESATKGSLGAIRGAVTIYYGDTEGVWPDTAVNFPNSLTLAGKYMDAIPRCLVPKNDYGNAGHSATNAVITGAATDTGEWEYWVATGGVSVNCTANDTKQSNWGTW